MSELARFLAGDNYLTRSASGVKRGLSALADSLIARSNEGTENMQAALSGVRVKPGAILTDAGYVMPDASGQPDFSKVGMEREPDVLRALELFGNIMGPAKGAAIAAKSGTGGKVAADVAHALPMDEASRMARAAEMGMNVSGFHGTNADISKFNTPVVWMSETPGFANRYAVARGAEGSNVIPVMGSSQSPFVFDRAERTQAPSTILQTAFSQARTMHPDSESFSNSVDKKEISRLMSEVNKAFPAEKGSPSAFEYWDNPAFVDYLSALGFDSVRVKEGGVPTVGVIGPQNVRSRFAAFDPAKADSADLLASRANLGPIVNALLQGYDRQ